MSDELKRFFKSIEFQGEEEYFQNAKVLKVIYLKQKKVFEVYIEIPNVLPVSVVEQLFTAAKNGINKESPCTIRLSYQTITEEDVKKYVQFFLKELANKRPSLVNLLESPITLDDEIITLEVSTKLEELEVKKEAKGLCTKLYTYGLGEYELTSVFNEKLNKEVKEVLEKSKNKSENVELPVYTPPVANEKPITGDVTVINNIMGDMKNVILEAYIFGKENMEREKINIITLKISDKTNSLLAKVFKKQKDEYRQADGELKVGNWYRFQGKVEFDTFSKDLVLSVRKYETIPPKEEDLIDDAEIPRVELHTHTMMSAMDGVVQFEEHNPLNIVKYAAKIGQKAIAITDHNCCQAFPEIYHTISSINKGKEGKDRFKALYGAEMNIVNDDVDLIFKEREYNLLENTFVVFDTETTGFYAGSDQMIEIGAVKIKNGEIIDRFDELIDPKRPIPKKITELTFITDEMVSGKDSEENVTRRFLDWAKDLPMVAHNAKFDISFMKAACNKYDFGEFDATVLDTMSLARMLHPEWTNHKLQTLTKKLDIPWDEEKHHRADYDAEGTALAFHKMCKVLYDQNISTTTELLANIDRDSLIRFSYPFHATIIAKNREGLKNLFKIVSIANTKYLYKNEQPKIPRNEVEKLREGLLIGSGCINGEVFDKAAGKEDEELVNMMSFYDYIEVQPVSAFTHLIGPDAKFPTVTAAEEYLKRIIRVAKEAGKPVVATGDVHNLRKEDKIYREIIVNQKFNGKLHPLNRKGIEVPNMYLKTTQEMLEDFQFLGEELAKEIVVTNSNLIADMVEEIEVIIATPKPFAPKIPNSIQTMTDLVYDKARDWYGDPLPFHIEDRLARELYGDALKETIAKNLEGEEVSAEEKEAKQFKILHDTIVKGYDSVKNYIKDYLIKNNEENKTEEELEKEAKKKLGGIIGAGYDVIYLIAQKLVKHSNDEGFLVGSRGSVGSSFVACMMGITEVNSLAAHYRCPKCKCSIFDDEEGNPLGSTYSSGFDLPDKNVQIVKSK